MLRLAGAERSADRRATFLFHPVSHTMQAQAQRHLGRSIERHRQLFELTLHNLYKECARLSAQTIARFGREELLLAGAAALKLGSIHRIEILDVKA